MMMTTMTTTMPTTPCLFHSTKIFFGQEIYEKFFKWNTKSNLFVWSIIKRWMCVCGVRALLLNGIVLTGFSNKSYKNNTASVTLTANPRNFTTSFIFFVCVFEISRNKFCKHGFSFYLLKDFSSGLYNARQRTMKKHFVHIVIFSLRFLAGFSHFVHIEAQWVCVSTIFFWLQ